MLGRFLLMAYFPGFNVLRDQFGADPGHLVPVVQYSQGQLLLVYCK